VICDHSVSWSPYRVAGALNTDQVSGVKHNWIVTVSALALIEVNGFNKKFGRIKFK